jgi:thiol-disulfide isomerase/thioredoxin
LAYRGYDADEELNTALAEVATGTPGTLNEQNDTDESEGQSIELSLENKNVAVFFLAPWCDWYLEKSRPEVSGNCVAGQRLTNALSAKYTGLVWRGISTRLWTGEKELKEYIEKYHVPYSLEIDKSNEQCVKYKIKDFPTLIVFSNGKEIFRTSNFEDRNRIDAMLSNIANSRATIDQAIFGPGVQK